ncbi:MAG: DUF4352 domain-containing protein [Bryobacteraceae bacterium]
MLRHVHGPAVAGFVMLIGCAPPAPAPRLFQLGERAQVGRLIYNVFEARWLTQAGEGETARRPSQRFLVLRMTVVNGGSEAATMPTLGLIDEAGEQYTELMDGSGIEGWLGFIRKVRPADTLDGRVVFDVPLKSYKLRVEDPADPQTAALVDLPLRFDSPVTAPAPAR